MESKLRNLIVPLSQRLINQLSASLQAAKAEHLTLMAIEVLVAKLIAGFALEWLSGLLATLFHQSKPSLVSCSQCQKKMPLQGYLSRRVISLFGHFSYNRAFYDCRACKQSRIPFDEQLALGNRSCSPRWQRMVAFLSAHLSFTTVSATLSEGFEVEVSAEAVRQVAEEVGRQCQDWEQQNRQSDEPQQTDKRLLGQMPKTWIIETDGKLVGFQKGSWQEVKVGVI